MKKSVVSALTAAVLMGAVATPAFAANPFSDVQPTHWAYKAVTELAEVGVIEGYGDYNTDVSLSNKFNGGRNITRYEMAQMIAQALARVEGETSPFNVHLVGHQWRYTDDAGRDHVVDGAVKAFNMGAGSITLDELNKLRDLVYEFQGELETLGVRVEDLRDHSDKVQWAGKIEYTYHNNKPDGGYEKDTSNGYIFRLEPVAYIDDNCWVATGNDLAPGDDGYRHGHWSARARLDSEGDMSDDSTFDTELKRVWAQADYDNFQLKLGRFEFFTNEEGLIWDSELSGAQVTFDFGKDKAFQATLLGGRMRSDNVGYPDVGEDTWYTTPYTYTTGDNPSNVFGINLQYDNGGRGLYGGASWYRVKDRDLAWITKNGGEKANIWGVNAGYRFNDMLKLAGGYVNNTKAETQKNSWQAELSYGNYDDASEKGQWSVGAGYRKFGYGASLAGTTEDDILLGYKGWFITASWAPFKNIGFIARYGHNKSIDTNYTGGNEKVKHIFGRVEFFF